MTPLVLQEGPLRLDHSLQRINPYEDEVHFYKGSIEKLQYIKEPCFVLFLRLSEEGEYGAELAFEYLTVQYIDNHCNLETPAEATHFYLITEPPVTAECAGILQERFSRATSNFPLKHHVKNPFS